jgi:hypothetical protein
MRTTPTDTHATAVTFGQYPYHHVMYYGSQMMSGYPRDNGGLAPAWIAVIVLGGLLALGAAVWLGTRLAPRPSA